MNSINKTLFISLLFTTLSVNNLTFNPAQAGEDIQTISDIITQSNLENDTKPEIKEIQDKCRVMISENNYDEAIKIIKDSLKNDPDNIDSLIILGNAYYAKKDFNSAKKTYENAEKIEPNNIFVQMKLDLLKNENK